jgi:hypothetical protein
MGPAAFFFAQTVLLLAAPSAKNLQVPVLALGYFVSTWYNPAFLMISG